MQTSFDFSNPEQCCQRQGLIASIAFSLVKYSLSTKSSMIVTLGIHIAHVFVSISLSSTDKLLLPLLWISTWRRAAVRSRLRERSMFFLLSAMCSCSIRHLALPWWLVTFLILWWEEEVGENKIRLILIFPWKPKEFFLEEWTVK